MNLGQSEGGLPRRERYDRDVAARLSWIAEQSSDVVVDALQAMTWAAPGDDDLAILHADAQRLADGLERYRADKGYDNDA